MSGKTTVGVDVGGTFTDVVLLRGDDLVTAKVPSTGDQSVGVMDGIEKACERAAVDPDGIDDFAHAMTVSVNALLEGNGARTALVTTEGFRDVLEIGRQNRPSLYDLDAEKPAPLVPRRRRFTVDERATTDGIERKVDPDSVRNVARRIEDSDAEAVAVCLLHAYAHPDNETTVADVLETELDVPISTSHEVLAEFREYERTSTTVADAYVTPAIDAYIGRLVERAAEAGVPEPTVMQANGGITDAVTVREHAVRTCLSGPAAGVVGARASVGGATDRDHAGLVTFDMGGTSSDVSLVREGEVERTTDAVIGDYPVSTPMVDVTTVGAGGGSIGWVDAGGALRVGPESAGADPGPVCYGQGGTDPTVTDANVVLGFIGSSTTLGGELEIDVEAARDALADLADEADLDGPLDAARGVYRVANATMTRAIRAVTLERGHDPRNFGLVAFGGAGPMHAAALADRLDISTVVVPRACGVLSAFGLLAADEKHDAVRTHRESLAAADVSAVDTAYEDLEAAVREDCSDPASAVLTRRADLRYAGQSFELTVSADRPFDPEAVARRFHAAHETTYGYRMDETVDLVNLRVEAAVERADPAVAYDAPGDALVDEREAHFADGARRTKIYDRERLPPGETVAGPAVLEQDESTVVLPPNWEARVDPDGTAVLTEGSE
ncbi:hydantoinase/oxoprolinase family protein [Halococcus hamelinensis]|uniref:N-methylhydantoinase A/acetone carboxylase, beta subunit n=2 Tax=Halococcus hamelinensis TaxID=332168 RepID=M0LRL7_9EURY|nr:hydantoinase/oxoprolinase family protein [Halococcus hamelinensis]EMA36232.1 N-methylhydantoinase A/acetone carboxylase, beta subunit [Halococcus hamelinensis 100A6]